MWKTLKTKKRQKKLVNMSEIELSKYLTYGYFKILKMLSTPENW